MGHLLVLDILGVLTKSDSQDKLNGLLAIGLAVLVLALSLVVATLLYYFVEEPSRRALRRIIEANEK